jgi:hypothetical protein
VAGPPATHDDTTPREPGADEPAHEGNIEVWVADGGTAERRWRFEGDEFSIGGHPTNQLVLRDGAVSRFHCEVRLDGTALAIRDLDSRNGTFVDGVRVKEAYLRAGCLVRLGRSALRIGAQPGPHAPELSERGAFGELVGDSTAMRAVFAVLERAAQSHATVLLEGETGTGKGAAALGLHQAGPRRGQAFQIVDCGSIPAGLVESELFGHEKGAFTGADASAPGPSRRPRRHHLPRRGGRAAPRDPAQAPQGHRGAHRAPAGQHADAPGRRPRRRRLEPRPARCGE